MNIDTEKLATLFKGVMQGLLSLAIVGVYLYLVINGSDQAQTLNAPVVGVFAFWFGQAVLGYVQKKP